MSVTDVTTGPPGSPSQWVLLEIDPEARARARLTCSHWPVRRAVADAVTRPHVDVGRLVDEADRWCDEHPEAGGSLNDDLARLAYLAAVEALDGHFYDEAVHLCTVGLRHARHNLSLWSHLALARAGQDDTEGALAAFTQAILECRRAGYFAPLLWILAARAFDEAGRPRTAAGLLEDVATFVPADDAFWELLATVRARAGTSPA